MGNLIHPRTGLLQSTTSEKACCNHSCGHCVENLESSDDMQVSTWHRSDCKFLRGQETENIPIGMCDTIFLAHKLKLSEFTIKKLMCIM